MSEVKVNKISPRTNCGTVQLGDSGDTITIPSGVTITNNGTQTGFGRTGTVNWDTTAKTASFTAESGNGYFVNTTSSAITVTLPASPSAGDIVAVKDYAATFATNNCTIGRNSSNIGGIATDLTLDADEASKTFVYVDGTQGWLVVNDATASGRQPGFVAATGGTVTTSGNFKIHTFTGPGTFCVSCAGNPLGSSTVDYLVIAGGGGGSYGGGCEAGGAGGAGGYRESSGAASGCYSRSPLGACVSALPVSVSPYPITVGGGGAQRTNGSDSIFSTITSAGGGNAPGPACGADGGSGGGARGGGSPKVGGAGNTPPVSPPQGNPGGNAVHLAGGSGGGGAGSAGFSNNTCQNFPGIPSPNSAQPGGNGGCGATSSINGSPTARAGGGGGGSKNAPTPSRGNGKDGGGSGATTNGTASTAGTANTGGGGGGGTQNTSAPTDGNSGGSGIVIIRYKFQ